MKPHLTFITLLCFLSLTAFEQKQCDFLGPLHFKNGKATVIFKAIYIGYTEANNPDIIEQLHEKKIINGRKYANVDTKSEGGIGGTDIDFSVDNCPVSYYATVAKNIDLNKLRWMQTIYMKCTVYQGVKNDRGQPYFTVEDISYSSRDLPNIDAIGPFMYIKNPPDDENRRWFSNAEPNDCLIAVSPKKALIETSDKKYHNFKFLKHTETKDGYVDLYKNGNESLELNINYIIDDGTTIAKSTGKATVTVNHKSTTFSVNGMGDDNHHHQTK